MPSFLFKVSSYSKFFYRSSQVRKKCWKIFNLLKYGCIIRQWLFLHKNEFWRKLTSSKSNKQRTSTNVTRHFARPAVSCHSIIDFLSVSRLLSKFSSWRTWKVVMTVVTLWMTLNAVFIAITSIDDDFDTRDDFVEWMSWFFRTVTEC